MLPSKVKVNVLDLIRVLRDHIYSPFSKFFIVSNSFLMYKITIVVFYKRASEKGAL